MSNWYVYIVRCNDQTYYTGITNDLDRRLAQHNGILAGGAKFTTLRQPVEFVYVEYANSRREACVRELQIKKMSRLQKHKLITLQSEQVQHVIHITC